MLFSKEILLQNFGMQTCFNFFSTNVLFFFYVDLTCFRRLFNFSATLGRIKLSFVIHYLSGGKKLIKLQIGKKGSEDMCGVSRVGACELFNNKLKTRAE